MWTAVVEVWARGGRHPFQLDGDRYVVGKSPANDIVLDDDPTVSRVHAVLERLGASWSVRDLDSTNGTWVNGERIWQARPLRPNDELRLGDSRLVYRDEPALDTEVTASGRGLPDLTRRERDVLQALCRPLVSGDVFTEPASIRRIADELIVTEAAVKHHLLRLYDKFAIYEPGERRRVRLANEAINRGAVSRHDLGG
jgi:hypothetical protein